ncbi:MAG: hypothetical protein BMS9Abin15_0119 [Gammaproteobacteria bacterium]|nr:MAG: hypothetical protein BMS9Abin15_0119 [Gammaproteobacteria bacterium]
MNYQLILFILVIIGILLLIAALFPIRILCKEQVHGRGWQILFGLIVLFIAGYTLFAIRLYNIEVTFFETVVSLVLFGGGCFVILVARISLLSIYNIKRIAALERHNALHDELTNLPNRTYLYHRISESLVKARNTHSNVAIFIMDLDRFKEINDTLGHHVGDRVLQQVAPRLRHVVRDTDIVARLGGDEFSILLPNADLETAITLSRRIIEIMKEPINVEQHNLKVGLSIGICLFPEHGNDSDTLLQRADVAMYIAKRNNSGYSVYDPELDIYSVNRLNLIRDLEDTIQNGGLTLYYQPIINMNNMELHSIEALARWPHSNGDFVPASDFIPLAEQTGLIQTITRWVVTTALAQFAEWRKQHIDCMLSINLSAKDLHNPDLPVFIDSQLSKWGIPPNRLILEITESSMMPETRPGYDVIGELNKLGVTLAIDDFGSGYSSLSYLKQLAANILKIDRSFIMDMMEDENDAVIVRSTIDLAHNMGKKVIAEGVHNQDILDILEILGCDMVQGFHISPPLPAAVLPDWVDKLQAGRFNLLTRPRRRTDDQLSA